MKKAYLECLRRIRLFRKSLITDVDLKRGKLYFNWIKDKTEKISNENDENYIYENVIKYTLPNYVITQYTFNKANKVIKAIIGIYLISKEKSALIIISLNLELKAIIDKSIIKEN